MPTGQNGTGDGDKNKKRKAEADMKKALAAGGAIAAALQLERAHSLELDGELARKERELERARVLQRTLRKQRNQA